MVFSYENKCSLENSEKPSLAFRFISVKFTHKKHINKNKIYIFITCLNNDYVIKK